MRCNITREIDKMALEEFLFWAGLSAMAVVWVYGLFRMVLGDIAVGFGIAQSMSFAAMLWLRVLARIFD